MAKKERLKNGLDMLFEDNFHDDPESGGTTAVQTIRISLIEPDKNQPRTQFDEEKLRELSENIAIHGVLQPILVRPLDNGSYRIVAGERRWRASRMAGLNEVPVVIRDLTDYEAAQISLIENLQREDLNPIEEAKAYQRLIDEFDMTQEQIAKSVGKSRAGIANSVRLLKLPDEVQKYVESKEISVGHAKLLCGIPDEKQIADLAKACIEKKLTVRELETLISNSEEKIKPQKTKKTADFADPFRKFSVETAMSFKQLYGIDAKVSKEKGGKVSMKMTFANEEEMQEILAKLSDKLEN
jgi:ParB family chromosome partitioning protein